MAGSLSAQPPGEPANRRPAHWLRLGGEYRARVEGYSDVYILNRFRVNLQVQPTGWMKVVAQGQDARIFRNNRVPSTAPYHDSMDLRVGYVEFGNAETEGVAIRAGRQELAFGEQRLIGGLSWTNTSRSFDAVRVALRHRGYRLDAFASSVVVFDKDGFNRSATGNNFHGLYGAIEKLVPRAIIELYALWRLAPAPRADFKTIGFRWTGRLPARFDYGVEMAGQNGRFGSDTVRAWAGHWLLARTLSQATCKPRMIAEYNYASGDEDPHDGKRGTFDHLYPTGHDKYGLADQVGWRNIHHVRGGVECKPRQKWLLIGSYNSWWLPSVRDGLYNAAGAVVARVADGAVAGRHVGQELDFQSIHSLSQQLQVGLGFAHIIPGIFLRKAAPRQARQFPYAMLTYRFEMGH